VSNSTIVVSSGSQRTAALVTQPLNITLSSLSNDLPTILVDIDSFLVFGGSRSYECRRSVFFDTVGSSIRCFVPANTLRLTSSLTVVIGLYNNSQIISTQLNFSLVNRTPSSPQLCTLFVDLTETFSRALNNKLLNSAYRAECCADQTLWLIHGRLGS
jgi:hypothetical protein